jgi:hypothetical protein
METAQIPGPRDRQASPYITKAELARRKHKSERQINRDMALGRAPAFVREPGSRRILFVLADVEARERQATFSTPAEEAARSRAAEQHNKGEPENHGSENNEPRSR